MIGILSDISIRPLALSSSRSAMASSRDYALVKMMIAPVIFCTVVHGIASMSDLRKVGRIGLKTLFYFEAVSTLALGIGLLIGKVLQPGKGFNIGPATLDASVVSSYVTRAEAEGIVNHLLAIIYNTLSGLSPKATFCKSCWSPP